MASSTVPRTTVPTFTFRSGLGINHPPVPPVRKKQFGDYCFRATCQVVSDGAPENACPIARVTGYDKNPDVAKDTEFVCATHVRAYMGYGYRCMPAEVVMMPGSNLECSGEMFFIMDGKTNKLV